jgi:hypothetical protein
MSKIARDPLYHRHRFPAEIIAHAVWLYYRFPLSLRMVEDMLAARGIIVTRQLTSLLPMPWRVSSIAGTRGSTTEPKTPISPLDDEKRS